MTTTPVAHSPGLTGVRLATVIVLALFAAAVFVGRGITVWQDDTLLPRYWMEGIVLAAVASLLAAGAVPAATRSMRWTAGPLGAALVIELWLSWTTETPPVALLPLAAALGVVLAPVRQRERDGVDYSRARAVLATASLVLMVPIGFYYLVSPLLFPPAAALGLVLVYAVLLAGTVRLAWRRSWWVLAGPVLATTIFFTLAWVAERFLGWSA